MIAALVATVFSLFLPPCASEDGTFCTWDADVQGNGAGTSFVVLTEDIVLYR